MDFDFSEMVACDELDCGSRVVAELPNHTINPY